MENKRKIYNLITVIVFIAFIFAFSITHILIKDVSESMEEQSLQLLPEFTPDSFMEGEFAEKMQKYYDDQFPFRSAFINFKAVIEKLIGKDENNGILIAKNGQQANKNFAVYSNDITDLDIVESDVFDKVRLNSSVIEQLENIKSKTESAKEQGVKITTVIPPRTIDVAASSFDFYPTDIWSSFNETVKSFDDGVNIIYMLDDLKARYENGEYVYYRTDHHWTSLGAYYCYLNVMKSFGIENEALPIESFEIEKASDSFYGAFYRTSGYKLTDPDSIDFYKNNNDDYVTNVIDIESGKISNTLDGLFDYENLKSNDQYTSFISGKKAYVRIERKDGIKREKLIILKDSFGQSLAPFLALHFDLEIYDFSAKQYKIIKKAIDIDCNKILIVCNAQNLIEQNYLKKIK